MKTKIGIVVWLVMGLFCYGQETPRKLLRGQVVNDSIRVENVIVFNVNSKMGTVTSAQGLFSINGKENDTLVFSSLLFKAKKVVLTKENINSGVLKIKLKTYTNQLNEVVIANNKNLQPIGNSQAIVDKKYMDDERSSPKNSALQTSGTVENGMDFVRMYKDVMKTLQKKAPHQNDFTSSITFTEEVMKRVNYSFFSETLKLKDDEIKLFLVFCENDSKSKSFLKSRTDFELMNFLIDKNSEFKTITTIEKK